MKFNRSYFNSVMGAQCINQSDLAESLGVSQATISEWKLGKSSPRGHRIFDLAEALDIDPADLFCNEGDDESVVNPVLITRTQKAEVIYRLNQVIASLAEGCTSATAISRIADLIQDIEGDL